VLVISNHVPNVSERDYPGKQIQKLEARIYLTDAVRINMTEQTMSSSS